MFGYRNAGEFFFCKQDGSPISESSWFITNVWEPAFKKVEGIACRRFRQTRHSYASEHPAKGVKPLKIAAAMGHKDVQMVLTRYAKFRARYDGCGVGMGESERRDYGL
jgi:integrase